MRATSVDLVDLVNKYFLLGYSYNEILQYLASFNGITLSLRQLNRILRSLGLFRRHHHISPNITLQTVQEELKGSSSEFGYRLMHRKTQIKRFGYRQRVRPYCIKGFRSRWCYITNISSF